jgi:hypothetical protein
MKITQAAPILKRVPPLVAGSSELVVVALINELGLRTRDDDICLDLFR